jgi:hypothetical protein
MLDLQPSNCCGVLTKDSRRPRNRRVRRGRDSAALFSWRMEMNFCLASGPLTRQPRQENDFSFHGFDIAVRAQLWWVLVAPDVQCCLSELVPPSVATLEKFCVRPR